MKFRKKPVVIEAVQWDGATSTANKFLGESYGIYWEYTARDEISIFIPTLEGQMRCSVGDWIIRGVAGEFYPIKAEIFKETYDPVAVDESGE